MRLAICFLAVLLIAFATSMAIAQPPPGRNVVLIVADDLGLQLGCYGDSVAKTPALDRLAAEGTRFTRAGCTTASCSASRSVILSGLHNHATGHYGHVHAEHHFSAYSTLRSLPVLLGEAGYRTASIGKVHVAPEEVFKFQQHLQAGIQGGRNPARMAELAEGFIKADSTKPFFLYFCPTDPHRSGAPDKFGNEQEHPGVTPVKFDPAKIPVPPWLPDQPEVRRELAEFYEATARVDDGVGRLYAALEKTGHLRDTLIILCSDNGPPFPNAKTNLYEPGRRLPLIVRRPAQKPGMVSEALVSWTDLTPTILDWAKVKEVAGQLRPVEVGAAGGSPKPAANPGKAKSAGNYSFHGRSFLGALEEAKPAGWDITFASHQFHEVTNYYPMRAVITPRYKLILNLAHPLPYPFASDLYASATWQGVLRRKDEMLGNRRVQDYLQRPRWELFDLESDPSELKNLADSKAHQPVFADLQAKLKAWQKETRDPWITKHEYE